MDIRSIWTDGGGIAALIAKVASGVLIISATGAVVALLSQVFLARLLGAEEYGWYVLYLAWVQVLVVPAVCGFDTAVLKYTSTYVAGRNWGRLRGLLSFSNAIVFGISIIIVSVAAAVILVADIDWPENRRSAMLMAIALIPILALTPMASQVLRGLKKVLFASSVTQILRPAVLLAIVVVLSSQLGRSMSAADALLANICAALLSLAMLLVLLRRILPSGVFDTEPQYESRLWISVAMPMVFMSAMYILLAKIDIIMIGRLASPTDAGIYAATSRLTGLVGFGLGAVNTIAAPMLAEHFARKDFTKLQLTLSWSARLAGTFTVVAATALWLLGDRLLAFFGDEFTAGYSALLVLLVGTITNAFAGSVGYMLVMGGQQVQAASIVGGAVVLNIVMNIILIPRYGMVGAAIATSTSTVIWNVVMFLVVRWKWQLNASIFGRVRSLD